MIILPDPERERLIRRFRSEIQRSALVRRWAYTERAVRALGWGAASFRFDRRADQYRRNARRLAIAAGLIKGTRTR